MGARRSPVFREDNAGGTEGQVQSAPTSTGHGVLPPLGAWSDPCCLLPLSSGGPAGSIALSTGGWWKEACRKWIVTPLLRPAPSPSIDLRDRIRTKQPSSTGRRCTASHRRSSRQLPRTCQRLRQRPTLPEHARLERRQPGRLPPLHALPVAIPAQNAAREAPPWGGVESGACTADAS